MGCLASQWHTAPSSQTEKPKASLACAARSASPGWVPKSLSIISSVAIVAGQLRARARQTKSRCVAAPRAATEHRGPKGGGQVSLPSPAAALRGFAGPRALANPPQQAPNRGSAHTPPPHMFSKVRAQNARNQAAKLWPAWSRSVPLRGQANRGIQSGKGSAPAPQKQTHTHARQTRARFARAPPAYEFSRPRGYIFCCKLSQGEIITRT